MNTPETYVRATVNYFGMIPFLGVTGPITRPYRMKKSIYERLLANGYRVKLVENTPSGDVKEVISAKPEPEETVEDVVTDVPVDEDTDNEQTTDVENDAEIVEDEVDETPSEDEIADEVVEDESEDDAPADDEEVLEDSDEDEEPADEDTADTTYYSDEDLEGLTKAELKAILKERGITINKNLTVEALKKKIINSNPEM